MRALAPAIALGLLAAALLAPQAHAAPLPLPCGRGPGPLPGSTLLLCVWDESTRSWVSGRERTVVERRTLLEAWHTMAAPAPVGGPVMTYAVVYQEDTDSAVANPGCPGTMSVRETRVALVQQVGGVHLTLLDAWQRQHQGQDTWACGTSAQGHSTTVTTGGGLAGVWHISAEGDDGQGPWVWRETTAGTVLLRAGVRDRGGGCQVFLFVLGSYQDLAACPAYPPPAPAVPPFPPPPS